jgi:hypothetical protein
VNALFGFTAFGTGKLCPRGKPDLKIDSSFFQVKLKIKNLPRWHEAQGHSKKRFGVHRTPPSDELILRALYIVVELQ